MKWFLLGAAAVAGVAFVVFPDLKRYLAIRRM